MTENMAARGEGVAGLVAEIKAIADAIFTTNAYRGRQLHRVGEKLLAAAPAGTAPRDPVRRLAESWPHESSVKVAAIAGSDQTVGWCAERTGRYAIQCRRCELEAALATPSPQAPPEDK